MQHGNSKYASWLEPRRYTFQALGRTVTVQARCMEEALSKARNVVRQRFKQQQRQVPSDFVLTAQQ